MRRVDLLALEPDDARRVVERCEDCAAAHFPSVHGYLGRVFLDPDLIDSRVGLIEGEDGALSGFQFMASHPLTVDGKRYVVLRSAVAKARNLAGHRRAFRAFGPLELVRQALHARAGGAIPWLVATSETPITYYRMAQLLSGVVPPPEPGLAAPPEQIELLRALARGVGFAFLPGRELCVPGLGVSLDERERASWEVRTEPPIRRFIQECPDFGQGAALLFGVPIGLATVVGMPLRLLRSR